MRLLKFLVLLCIFNKTNGQNLYKKVQFYTYQWDIFNVQNASFETKSSSQCGAFCSSLNCTMFKMDKKSCQISYSDKKAKFPNENADTIEVFVNWSKFNHSLNPI